MDQCNQLVLDYLLKRYMYTGDKRPHSSDLNIWSLSSKLLCQVAASYFTFFKAYTAYLTDWGNGMVLQYKMDKYSWRHKSHQSDLSWHKLVLNFCNLMLGPYFVRDTVRRLLYTLSQSGVFQSNRNIWHELYECVCQEGVT
uniref:Uncharacterized protein LOC102800894 n=1 Tax=Saccoglossus kowalevskii TaxID=10224 RepID=A0ABM0MRU2_SACKO|nr:PREDICTED: uncharacterized protein LOC102800894 [Saccoglossus kowalevskii]